MGDALAEAGDDHADRAGGAGDDDVGRAVAGSNGHLAAVGLDELAHTLFGGEHGNHGTTLGEGAHELTAAAMSSAAASRSMTPAATAAAYSPIEWPATAAGANAPLRRQRR